VVYLRVNLRGFRLPKHITTAFCIGILCTFVSSNDSYYSKNDVHVIKCVLQESELFQITNFSQGIYQYWDSYFHKSCVYYYKINGQILSVRTRLVSIRSINIIDFFTVKNSLKLKKTHAKLNLQTTKNTMGEKILVFRPIKLSKYIVFFFKPIKIYTFLFGLVLNKIVVTQLFWVFKAYRLCTEYYNILFGFRLKLISKRYNC